MQYYKINLDDPEEKKAYLKVIEEGSGQLEIIHEFVGPGRTPAQNKRYRVMLTLLSQHTGHSEAWFHKRLKTHLVPNVKWHPFAVLSTADMTKREFQAYMDWVESFWDELIEDPSMLLEEMECSPIITKTIKSNGKNH